MLSTLHTIFSNILHSNASRKDKFRLSSRILLHIPYQLQLQRLFQQYHLEDIPAYNPRHYYRFTLPYLNKNLENKDKLHYIEDHLKKLSGLKPMLWKQIYQDSLLILDFNIVEQPIRLKVSYFEQFEKEGDLTFYLEDANSGQFIYTMTGIFSSEGFMIGGFQGGIDNAMMRTLTKTCHGMRPHNLLFFCATEFCRALGCETICGISRENHISNQKNKTKERIQFDYNNFWGDFTDQQEHGGWYTMTCQYPLKPIEDVKSKKRGMYRKRYLMLDQISSSIKKKAVLLYSKTF